MLSQHSTNKSIKIIVLKQKFQNQNNFLKNEVCKE